MLHTGDLVGAWINLHTLGQPRHAYPPLQAEPGQALSRLSNPKSSWGIVSVRQAILSYWWLCLQRDAQKLGPTVTKAYLHDQRSHLRVWYQRVWCSLTNYQQSLRFHLCRVLGIRFSFDRCLLWAYLTPIIDNTLRRGCVQKPSSWRLTSGWTLEPAS